MAMYLDEFLVDHPIDRGSVVAHKQRILAATEETKQRDDAEVQVKEQ